jgi:trehalose/maltose hydrolase-like predicted phosphorylase
VRGLCWHRTRSGGTKLALNIYRGWVGERAKRDLRRRVHTFVDGGIHIAALGGIWMTAVLGFAGVSLTNNGIALDPQLPPNWRSLAFGVQWRGRSLKIRIGRPLRGNG